MSSTQFWTVYGYRGAFSSEMEDYALGRFTWVFPTMKLDRHGGHIRNRHEIRYKRRCLLGKNMFLPETLRRFLFAQECVGHDDQ